MLTIGFALPPGFQIMGLAAASAFELANASAKDSLYGIRLLSEQGGPVPNSFGMSIETRPMARQKLDTLIVSGRLRPEPSSPGLIKQVQKAAESTRRIASVCTGAFILGEAGLLDGRRVTTHWVHARNLQKQFPNAHVEDDRIFIIDGNVWTSAGMSAGIDLALGMIEKDFGIELARVVAQKMVVYHRRAGGQSQHSALLEMDATSDRIQGALAYARRNLRAPLSVEELAEAAHLSPRQFSRAFRAETGQSPAKAVEHLRVEAARVMIEQSRHTLEEVANETGFADPERMRRAFLRTFGQPPQVMRRNARLAAG
ncbi:transcriptional regulator GlxA family with amidase domain [Lysobacter niabensis]|uniref:Transcriptional regulator GlxA family with amidase domain n=1 Tax=Agrilutibacter niabensis TaxID=380628 RepID=A0ABU1VN36_9GAMM|nr:GlxA family transcriptional regulator [Lysobacter niabensis]MDR7098533.1 transcriptional regulator GlxA family with amidase domain [Lysobacter niabensis]